MLSSPVCTVSLRLTLLNVYPFPPTGFPAFFGTMGTSDSLLPFWVPIAFPWFGSHTLRGDNRASSVLYEIAIIGLAKFSDRGLPQYPHQNGSCSVVCCLQKSIDQFQPHNYVPAQSLYFRFGSASPCPTLKPDVTTSVPRTRYGWLVGPYPVGFPYSISSAYQCGQILIQTTRGKQTCLFSQLALYILIISQVDWD